MKIKYKEIINTWMLSIMMLLFGVMIGLAFNGDIKFTINIVEQDSTTEPIK